MATAVQAASQSCGCKGVRFCALCEMSERVQNLLRKEDNKYADYDVYVYKTESGECVRCPSLTPNASIEEVMAGLCIERVEEQGAGVRSPAVLQIFAEGEAPRLTATGVPAKFRSQ
ncbi:hypothetical protein TELCIR_02803 [Teladorsagia circumcincta]|uniref:Uncharacterized protein n=1 Tax=Teladorsagia circumcincta TaxID=45464 RepID=A0A2G9UZJ6_TELCI|nr:hypothetical protein TELCIR_02803 [Teladorsagia circumcincta]